jgi:hypothetical protein
MALTKITNSLVAINAIQGTLIADNAVTAVHIVNNAITATQLADNAVTATKIQNGIIAADHLAADLITATKIADDAISEEHLDVTVISSLSTVTANSSDYVMLGDTSDSNNLKKALVSDFLTDITGKLSLSGGTMTGDLILGDNVKIEVGSASGGDLQIYHNGTNSYATSGTGQFFLASSNSNIWLQGAEVGMLSTDGAEYLIRATTNGAVSLYYDNAVKLATTSGGVTVTGTLIADNITMYDDEYIRLGDSNDLQIYHSGTYNRNYIQATGSNHDLTIAGDEIALTNSAISETFATFVANGAANLYYDNAVKLATVTGGINITGDTDTDTLTVSGVTTIANTSAANVNNESHILIRNLANGNIVTDGLTYNCAEDKLGVGTNLFLAGGYIRSGAADLGFGTASMGQLIALSNTTGNVGIRTTTPSYPLEVTGSSAKGIYITGVGYNANTGHIVTSPSGNTTYLAMVYLNSSASNVGRIQISSNSAEFFTSSDYRLKENVTTLENGLDRVNQLKPVKFDWKFGGETDEGFLAHEVEGAFPYAVTGEKDAVDEEGEIQAQALNYAKFTPLLVKAIQELEARLTAGGL